MTEEDNNLLLKISKIEDLAGMTVNERLYVSGLMKEFDRCRKQDKERAKQILSWLRVDRTSIEKIIS
ncbi:hypothetical protein [Nibribacter koreensis]|uniref:Uncharacterized protein n=1 Tax=Nibribacter koreensis TaxID=1084519 RepID=A0ABP8FLP4_9BACT